MYPLSDDLPDITSAGWGAPKQQDPPGWTWETSGVHQQTNAAVNFIPKVLSDSRSYFDAAYYPASSTMLHGQEGAKW